MIQPVVCLPWDDIGLWYPYSRALDKGLNYYMRKYKLHLVDTPTCKTYCENYRK